jgi:hypothetical protein
MKRMVQLLFAVCLATAFSVNLSAQEKQSCQITEKLGGKFKVVKSSISLVDKRNIFFLTIKLSPEKFTKDYLLKVAQRVREKYCNETIIYTEIWDSSDKRKFDDLMPAPIYSPWTKAFYSLDKTSGKELIRLIADSKVSEEILLNQ